jgi:hypothetical protein
VPIFNRRQWIAAQSSTLVDSAVAAASENSDNS